MTDRGRDYKRPLVRDRYGALTAADAIREVAQGVADEWKSKLVMNRAPRHGESLEACVERLTATIDALRTERVRIAAVLDAFRQAPLSVSSVQPILQLAEELNGAMAL